MPAQQVTLKVPFLSSAVAEIDHWDTECYAAIQTEWPMLRPPATAAAQTKLTSPPAVTSTSAVLLETMPDW